MSSCEGLTAEVDELLELFCTSSASASPKGPRDGGASPSQRAVKVGSASAGTPPPAEAAPEAPAPDVPPPIEEATPPPRPEQATPPPRPEQATPPPRPEQATPPPRPEGPRAVTLLDMYHAVEDRGRSGLPLDCLDGLADGQRPFARQHRATLDVLDELASPSPARAAPAAPSLEDLAGTPGPDRLAAPAEAVLCPEALGVFERLGMRLRRRPPKAARPRHAPAELVAPDGYSFARVKPSHAAAAALRVLWASGPDLDPAAAAALRELEAGLRRAGDAPWQARHPGDELCDSPPPEELDTQAAFEGVKAAEARVVAVGRRLAELRSQETSGYPGGQRQGWVEQEIKAEEWREAQALKELDELHSAATAAGVFTPPPRSPPPPGPGAGAEAPCPALITVEGSPEALVDGLYALEQQQQQQAPPLYLRQPGGSGSTEVRLYHDGVKWGFVAGGVPVLVSRRAPSSSPCAVPRWFAADPGQRRFIGGCRVKVSDGGQGAAATASIEAAQAAGIDDLVAMGFTAAAGRHALERAEGNVNRALDYLENMAPGAPPDVTPPQPAQEPSPLPALAAAFPTIDSQVVADVLAQTDGDAAHARALLAELAEPSTAPAEPAAPPPPHRYRITAPDGLPLYRAGTRDEAAAAVLHAVGPRRHDVVTGVHEGGWVDVAGGVGSIPAVRGGAAVVEEVHDEVAEAQRGLGERVLALAADPRGEELLFAVQYGRVELATVLWDAQGAGCGFAGVDIPALLSLMEASPAFDTAAAAARAMTTRLQACGALRLRDAAGRTLLHRSAAAGRARLTRHVLDALRSGGDGGVADAVDAGGRYAFHHALDAKVTDAELFRQWQGVLRSLASPAALAATDPQGDNALHSALKAGRTGRAIMLLDFGADATARDGAGRLPLMVALTTPACVAQGRGVAVVAQLCAAMKDGVDALEADGETPLTAAVRSGCATTVKVLLDAGADPAVRNRDGRPPLLLAVEHVWKEDQLDTFRRLMAPCVLRDAAVAHSVLLRAMDPSKVCMLRSLCTAGLAAGAAEAAQDGLQTALHVAAARRVEDELCGGWLDVLRRICTDAPGALQARDIAGNTPLHVAARDATINVVVLFATLRPGAEEVNDRGEMPLHLACENEAFNVSDKGTLGPLVAEGNTNVNAKDQAGDTPLHRAVRAGRFNTARQLVTLGASRDVANADGKPPYALLAEDPATAASPEAAEALKFLTTQASALSSMLPWTWTPAAGAAPAAAPAPADTS
eukprot:TRINITY_DN5443_c0_g4_i2.p1 TRINITY_DN5443_c0_g4~~TRINITY_DN5443_c0_g4_i2.p1  ORF type:complete len:1246 (+),score=370.66 TRINITY_DN5443_c0_g4_i2:52-3789(+)